MWLQSEYTSGDSVRPDGVRRRLVSSFVRPTRLGASVRIYSKLATKIDRWPAHSNCVSMVPGTSGSLIPDSVQRLDCPTPTRIEMDRIPPRLPRRI